MTNEPSLYELNGERMLTGIPDNPVDGPNIPLLRKYVEWAEEQEQREDNREWYQGAWAISGVEIIYEAGVHYCDTAYCIAGKVAYDHGWQPVFVLPNDTADYVEKNGKKRWIPNVAAEILGINANQAGDLFDASNDARAIREAAEDIAGEKL